VAWVDVMVYGPGGTSLTLTATGNPAFTTVSRDTTGGQKVSVPVGLKSTSAGAAMVVLAPSQPGHGGAWYGTTLYGM
jgi:hypothetical protein